MSDQKGKKTVPGASGPIPLRTASRRRTPYIIISPSLETLLNRIREITVNTETTVARAQALPSVALATAL